MNKEKYTSYVYDAIQEYFITNFNSVITTDEIDEMDRGEVLEYFLNWEGILGYTYTIKKIMGYFDCELVELEKEGE